MNVPIVNNKDEVIGSKPRVDLNFEADIFRTASLWITNSHGKVLLAQRKHNKKVDPGKWAEAVGGTVEGTDSYQETVVREAKEEIGLDLKAENIVIGPKQLVTKPCSYFVQWYKVIIDWPLDRFTIQRDEIEKLDWVPLLQFNYELKTTPEKYIAAMPEIERLLNE